MSDKAPDNVITYNGSRSKSLSTACVLSFMGSGFSAFGLLIIFLLYYDIPKLAAIDPSMMGNKELVDFINSAGRGFFISMSLLNLVSLTGAILMWFLRKPGFHLYTLSQLLMLLLPFFMVSGYSLPLPNALLTTAFIFLYSSNLSIMK